MKVIRLMAKQIPMMWDQIKFAVVNANQVQEAGREEYLIKLLHSLLSDKAQCFIRMDDNRYLVALMITRIGSDVFTGDKVLFIDTLFSYARVTDEQWIKEFPVLSNFARTVGCKRIVFNYVNPRIEELARLVNFTEYYKCLKYEIVEA